MPTETLEHHGQPRQARGAASPPLIPRSWRHMAYPLVLVVLAAALWLPRLRGPLDLRYDAGVYYVLGASMAEGNGYRLLSEPGEIQGIQYPPALPSLIAVAAWAAGTADPAVIGPPLRALFAAMFLLYVVAVFTVARQFLPEPFAFLAALFSMLHVHVVWLSDLLFTEIPFTLVSLLLVLAVRRAEWQWHTATAGLLGAVAFLLRTAGIALLAAWVGESLLRRRFRTAAIRLALALVPVVGWQTHIAQVKEGPEYTSPAYPYQRAAYQFYNVTYLENLAYVDPFQPELGKVSVHGWVNRVASNLIRMPESVGAAVMTNPRWASARLNSISPKAPLLGSWLVGAALAAIGAATLAGLVLLAARSDWLVPLYAAGAVALVCLTPWPAQFDRYLSPLTPFLAISLMVALSAGHRLAHRVSARTGWTARVLIATTVAAVLLVQAVSLQKLFAHSGETVYRDASGGVQPYRLFYYDGAWRAHDQALEWLRAASGPGEIIATSTPHWAYLTTGRQAVMPPFEADTGQAQRLLDAVPVRYLVLDQLDFIDISSRYAAPMVRGHPGDWELVYVSPDSAAQVYRRTMTAGSTGSQNASRTGPP